MTGPEDPGTSESLGAFMEAMGEFATVAETLAGFRAQLMAQGFDAEHAGALVVESMRSANFNTEKDLIELRRSLAPKWPWQH